MFTWQQILILIYVLIALISFIRGLYYVRHHQVYSLATPFQFLGIYVWGDALLIAPCWIFTSIISLIIQDWLFFLLTISVFWVIRGLGETIYWLNQQYSTIKREPPEKFWHFRLVQNDSVWFLNQVFSQTITVIALLVTLYLLKLWFHTI